MKKSQKHPDKIVGRTFFLSHRGRYHEVIVEKRLKKGNVQVRLTGTNIRAEVNKGKLRTTNPTLSQA
ncbi:hypothetical protein KKF32_03180 [Patescibacteria group bacterium]|nr:hypothetical protein [Patescibacteria group bacterium]